MLTEFSLHRILNRIPTLTIGVLGDLFLDRYLDIDSALTEPSIETGLDAYQVVSVRSYPGAAGTVINNLVALGVRKVVAISAIGDDGEGHELRQALADFGKKVDAGGVFIETSRSFRTPTYTKPMLHEGKRAARELNRLDIKNRSPLPADAEAAVLQALEIAWNEVDALLVLDQVSVAEAGIVTNKVRELISTKACNHPAKFVLADSRERIGLFRNVMLKPNQSEFIQALTTPGDKIDESSSAVWKLACQTNRPVFCTQGDKGILVAEPTRDPSCPILVPAYPVSGPIDIVGAGDSTSAGIACALAAGASLTEAAAFGNLVASITIKQIGVTGTATPEMVRERWKEVCSKVQETSSNI